jgi:hypothetical protein
VAKGRVADAEVVDRRRASSVPGTPTTDANAAFTRWIVPSRSTSAMPVGAASNADRSRSSLSTVRARAFSFRRHETTFTTESAATKSACTPAHRHGCSIADGWLNTVPGTETPITPWCSSTNASARR